MTRSDLYRKLRSRRGASRLATMAMWIGLILFALALYMFAEPIYDNWALGGTFRAIAMKSAAMEDVTNIKTYALEQLHKRGFNITEKQLIVEKNGKFIDLSATYPVQVGLPGIGPLMVMTFSKSGSNR